MDGPRTSTELHGLASSTEYLLSVFPVYEAGAGEGLRGLVTTGGWGSAPIPGEAPPTRQRPGLSDPQCPLLSTSDVTVPSPQARQSCCCSHVSGAPALLGPSPRGEASHGSTLEVHSSVVLCPQSPPVTVPLSTLEQKLCALSSPPMQPQRCSVIAISEHAACDQLPLPSSWAVYPLGTMALPPQTANHRWLSPEL